MNGATLEAGDGAAFEHESAVTIEGIEDGELLAFDLA